MKKGMIIMCVVTMICALFAGCGKNNTKLPDCFDEETVKTEAKELIELAESDNFDEFIKHFDESLTGSMTEKVYQEQYLAVVKQKGTFQSFGNAVVIGQTDEKTGANYAGVVIVAEYEEGKIQYTVGFNEDMKVIQFLIK